MDEIEAVKFIEKEIGKIKGAIEYRPTAYHALGIVDALFAAKIITGSTYVKYSSMICADYINNPKYFDR